MARGASHREAFRDLMIGDRRPNRASKIFPGGLNSSRNRSSDPEGLHPSILRVCSAFESALWNTLTSVPKHRQRNPFSRQSRACGTEPARTPGVFPYVRHAAVSASTAVWNFG